MAPDFDDGHDDRSIQAKYEGNKTGIPRALLISVEEGIKKKAFSLTFSGLRGDSVGLQGQ